MGREVGDLCCSIQKSSRQVAVGLLFKGSLEEPVAQLLLGQPRVAGASVVASASSFEDAGAAYESRSACH